MSLPIHCFYKKNLKKKKNLIGKIRHHWKMDYTYGIQASSHTPQHAKWCFFLKCQKFMFIQVRGYTFV